MSRMRPVASTSQSGSTSPILSCIIGQKGASVNGPQVLSLCATKVTISRGRRGAVQIPKSRCLSKTQCPSTYQCRYE